MKNQPGKNMAILGSGSIVSEFAQRGLIDEISILLNPVILGGGRSIFQGIKDRFHLKLLKARTFDMPGNVLLHYQFVKQRSPVGGIEKKWKSSLSFRSIEVHFLDAPGPNSHLYSSNTISRLSPSCQPCGLMQICLP